MNKTVLIHQADRIKPEIRNFAIRHMEGILASCTKGSDEAGRWRVATDIVDQTLNGSMQYHLAEALLTQKVMQGTATIYQAADDVYWDHDFTSRVLGRAVWDCCYQRGKHLIPWQITMH